VKAALAQEPLELGALGEQMYTLVAELFPTCRSITGDGLRATLRSLQQFIPVILREVPSGTRVFDWTVPAEWNIRDAFVKNAQGERVIDFRKSNLHVVNYSVAIHQKMSLEQLKPHLFTLPERPDWIPYHTSYYKKTWGFCLTHNQLNALPEGQYEVHIDSSLEDGHLTYGELYLPGETGEEILISTHSCHPSLANDNLSGVAITCFLAKHISQVPHRYSYRFLFVPGTIGAITWLSLNESTVSRIKHGLVIAGVGDAGPLSYKKSRRGNAEVDRAAMYVLRQYGPETNVMEFSPRGYDERQYCSPGFNLPVGRISRSPHGTFPEYHTSADNLEFVSAIALGDSFSACLSIFSILEGNATYLNTNPKCEPQLGERGLYRTMGGLSKDSTTELALLWVLNLSDGDHTLLDIAERSQISFEGIHRAALLLRDHGLLKQVRNSYHGVNPRL